MFSITPYAALREVARVNANGTTTIRREPCRVIGIDTSGEAPRYVVEIRGTDGSFYLAHEDVITKPAPTAPH